MSMTPEERERVREVAVKAKTVQCMAPSEMAFLEQMFNEHPEEYSEICDQVHDEVTAQLNPLYRRKR